MSAMRTFRILIAGDVHGCFSGFQELIIMTSPALALQCGDFGYWPRQGMRLPDKGFRDAQGRLVPVRFCDGNHENHPELRKLVGSGLTSCEIAPGIFYQPRGSTLELPDGRTVLFAGGADSVDKDARVEGIDWFPEELLTDADFERFPDLPSVHMVISHTAPACMKLPPQLDGEQNPDSSRAVLDRVLERYKPRVWFCARYHLPFDRMLGHCNFHALDCAVGTWNRPQSKGAALLEVYAT